jgi:hypothetical protein
MYDKMVSVEISKNIGMKTSFGGIRLRTPNIFWSVKITVWG